MLVKCCTEDLVAQLRRLLLLLEQPTVNPQYTFHAYTNANAEFILYSELSIRCKVQLYQVIDVGECVRQ